MADYSVPKLFQINFKEQEMPCQMNLVGNQDKKKQAANV